MVASGSSRRKTSSATSSPEITPACFCVIVARARAVWSTVASVVASPSPTSSASARSMRSVSVVVVTTKTISVAVTKT